MDTGLAGGLAGGVIGLMGAAIGTYFSIRNTKGPRARAFMIRLSVLGWLWVGALLAWLILMPRPWKHAAIFLNAPLILSIPWLNRRLARLEAEDEAEA